MDDIKLIRDTDTEIKVETYPKIEIALDVALFLLATWSEFGYALFTGSSASESILDPLKRYVYPAIPSDTTNNITQSLNIATQVLSYSDAALTIATILDIRKKRGKFIIELKNGFNQLKSKQIKLVPFIINLSIFTSSFFIISLSPWTGLKTKSFSTEFLFASGISMFLGQMAILILQYGGYIFSTPKSIIDFYKLPLNEKKAIFHNIFCTKKGMGVALRSLANVTTMGMRFHGISLFTNKLLFGDTAFRNFYSTLAPISIIYRTLSTQSLKDYKATFKQDSANLTQIQAVIGTEHHQAESVIQIENQGNCANQLKKILLILLGGLIGMSFLLRTFSTPALFTGPIDNPESNYDIKSTLLGCLGLLLGAFASYQYCKFMWGLGKDASNNLSKSNCGFFKTTGSSHNTLNINNSYKSIAPMPLEEGKDFISLSSNIRI